MGLFPKKLRQRLSRENRAFVSPPTLFRPIGDFTVLRKLAHSGIRFVLTWLILTVAVLFLGSGLIGTGTEFRASNAALIIAIWIAARGFHLAGRFLTEVKFSARSRTLLALPAPESLIVTTALRHLRWQPFRIWLEFAILIALGTYAREAGTAGPFPVGHWLIGTTAALFGVLGVATWSVLVSSRLRWNLPTDRLLAGRGVRLIFICGIAFLITIGDFAVETLTDWSEAVYPWLRAIPLVGWPARCFDPVPDRESAWLFPLATAVTALVPLFFAKPLLKRATTFLSTHAPALLATHWRSAEIAAPSPPTKSRPKRRRRKTRPTLATAKLRRFLKQFRFIEDFANQWFTKDERRAMLLHLGPSFPPWTRDALTGCLHLLAIVPLTALAKSTEADWFETPAYLTALTLLVLGLRLMLGGATPSRGLRVISLGSFNAPLFSGWPIRVSDLVRADWKVAILRNLAALPVAAAVAYFVGWTIGTGNESAARAAINMTLLFLILSIIRPIQFVSSLSNAVKKPNFFSKAFWIILVAGSPMVLTIFLMAFGAFLLMNVDHPVAQFGGFFLAAGIVLPTLLLVWLYRVLFNRARISLETVSPDE